MHTSIDGLVAEFDQKYGFRPPLAELAVSNVYEDIHWKAESVSYLGEATAPGGFLGLGGVACHRLALSGKVMDAELWVRSQRSSSAAIDCHSPQKPLWQGANQGGILLDWNLAGKRD